MSRRPRACTARPSRRPTTPSTPRRRARERWNRARASWLTFYESGQIFGGVDVVVDTEIVAGYDLDLVRVGTHPRAGPYVALSGRRDIRPDRSVEPHRVALPSVVRRCDRGACGRM